MERGWERGAGRAGGKGRTLPLSGAVAELHKQPFGAFRFAFSA